MQECTLKTDDNAFVKINEVVSSLKRKASNAPISFKSSHQSDKDKIWYISDEEWPHPLALYTIPTMGARSRLCHL